MNKKKLVIAFSGPSNSGKTTAIVKVSSILQDRGFKVCIIKHDPKDKAIFDKPGKDSFKFSQTGADVAIVSPNRTTIFMKDSLSVDDMINLFGEFDYLLVEGLKTLDIPRISIFRQRLDESYFPVTNAINWIDKNAKRV